MQEKIDEQNNKIGKFWSAFFKQAKDDNFKTRWWQSPLIIRHVNQIVSGENVDGFSQGLINEVKKSFSNIIPFKNGISVGCGVARKEINLVKQGIVENFDLFELSEECITQGKRLIKENKIDKNIRYKEGDAFEVVKEIEKYDFVHWNSALHHMIDAHEALRWSKKILKKGGLFFMDDFVGATRFQWSDRQLEIVSRVRGIFNGTKYMLNPKNTSEALNSVILRPSKEVMIESDPSEAADSENIINAVKLFFPKAKIIKTGGAIYHLALSDMIHNFNETSDKILLDLLMFMDELCVELGENHYAVALALKE
ncbi:MAG: class I SAM-dependent methyltransferase [Parcubacteria group bacterium]|jgi:SAM-dependent methyltransferase